MTTTTNQPHSTAGLTRADLGMIAAISFWGTNMTISKLTFMALTPLSFNVIRFLIAPTILVALVLLRERTLAIPRHLWGRFLWLALVGNIGYQMFYVVGLNLTTASNSALLIATTPLWVALIGTLRGSERLSPRAWAGIGLALLGIVLVLAARGVAFSQSTLLGDFLVIMSAICWAFYTVSAGPVLRECSPLKAATIPMLLGSPILIIIGLPDAWRTDWIHLPVTGYLGVLYSAIFSIALAYIFWYNGVQQLGPARSGVYASLIPVVGVIAAWVGLGEPIILQQVIGAVAILCGLWLTRRTS